MATEGGGAYTPFSLTLPLIGFGRFLLKMRSNTFSVGLAEDENKIGCEHYEVAQRYD